MNSVPHITRHQREEIIEKRSNKRRYSDDFEYDMSSIKHLKPLSHFRNVNTTNKDKNENVIPTVLNSTPPPVPFTHSNQFDQVFTSTPGPSKSCVPVPVNDYHPHEGTPSNQFRLLSLTENDFQVIELLKMIY